MTAMLSMVVLLASGDRIVLRDDAPVEGRFVRLFDVIDDETLPADARALLSDVWLGRAPATGETREITAGEIRDELRRRGIRVARFTFVGSAVTVRRAEPGSLRAERAARRLLSENLRGKFAGSGDSRGIAVRISYLSRTDLPAGVELVSVVPREPLRIGPVGFTAVLASGEDRIEVEGIARICRRVQVVLAARDIRRNRILREEDLEVKTLELESTDGYCTETTLLVGGRLLQDVKAGEAIAPGFVRMRNVVRPHDAVLVENGSVRAWGTSLSRGTIGDVIRVKFEKTDSVVLCRITGAGRAAAIRGNR